MLTAQNIDVSNFPDKPPDLWTWRVMYDDNSVLEEHGHLEHGWADVALARVVLMQAIPTREDLPRFAQLRDVDSPYLPVFFRRRSTPWLIGGGDWQTITCMGLELPNGGGGSYMFWDEQGHVVHTLDRNAI